MLIVIWNELVIVVVWIELVVIVMIKLMLMVMWNELVMTMVVRIEQTRLVISSIPVDKETLRGCLLSLCRLWHISLCVIFAFADSGIFATREMSFIVVCHVSLARSCVPTALLTNSNGFA